MSQIALRAENLSKRYRIGARQARYKTIREAVVEAVAAPFHRRDTQRGMRNAESIWALKDVSLEIGRGEVVGIIGRNGAGKTTFLKILSRITKPTEGHADIYGRVGSLLEVGTGFHPELTGRENIYLNGAILGMKKIEIDRKFDEMVAFAEIDQFIDTPVKHYSSGMYVRLAFAVAAHLEPEILLVDEVLAVGDAQFQKKCLGKMGQVAREGRTVLFVSHNMNAVYELCARTILLEGGRKTRDGHTPEVVEYYLSSGASLPVVHLDALTHTGPQAYARLNRLTLLNKHYEHTTAFVMNEPFIARIEVECIQPMRDAEVGLKISSRYGAAIHYLTSTWEGLRGSLAPGRHTFEVCVPQLVLFPGKYQVGLWVLREGEWSDDNVQEVTYFEVIKGDVTGFPTTIEKYAFSGCEVYTPSEWKLVAAGEGQNP